MRKINEECGVFGVYREEEAPLLTYFGLHALQHRGQEGAGIACADGRDITCRKGCDLLTEVFRHETLEELKGHSCIGHVRYATAGGNELENVQPLAARSYHGCVAVVHNGQIVNAAPLRRELEEKGSIFRGTSDSEIILHLIQGGTGSLLEKIEAACRRLEGAFSFLILTEKNLYAIRDKNGIRPLSIGRTAGGSWCVSSETCAFGVINARFVRDVAPGEIVKFSASGAESFFYTKECTHRLCAMEYIYFSRPDSMLEGRSVHAVRKETGRRLARLEENGTFADIVVGVPDSSLSAAMGYSEELGLPYEMGLIKNKYTGRTFIQPTQKLRDTGVRMKLSANQPVVEGKRVVLIDDSLVRGTTSRRIVQLLREAGAAEVHLRIASPEMKFPCFYGVDTSTRAELASANHTPQELCRLLGADSLRFLPDSELCGACGGDSLCRACFTGSYVTPLFGCGESAGLTISAGNAL